MSRVADPTSALGCNDAADEQRAERPRVVNAVITLHGSFSTSTTVEYTPTSVIGALAKAESFCQRSSAKYLPFIKSGSLYLIADNHNVMQLPDKVHMIHDVEEYYECSEECKRLSKAIPSKIDYVVSDDVDSEANDLVLSYQVDDCSLGAFDSLDDFHGKRVASFLALKGRLNTLMTAYNEMELSPGKKKRDLETGPDAPAKRQSVA